MASQEQRGLPVGRAQLKFALKAASQRVQSASARGLPASPDDLEACRFEIEEANAFLSESELGLCMLLGPGPSTENPDAPRPTVGENLDPNWQMPAANTMERLTFGLREASARIEAATLRQDAVSKHELDALAADLEQARMSLWNAERAIRSLDGRLPPHPAG